MANFDLPNDIVLMILNCVAAKPATKHPPREFAVLAGVCQQWRRLAVPIICSSAKIRCISVSNRHPKNPGLVPGLESDIPEIIILGGQSYVKSVFFEFDAGKHLLDFLEAIVSELQHTSIAWTGVKALRFIFYGHSVAIPGYLPIALNKKASDGVLKLAADLADSFPNVLELHTKSRNYNIDVGALVGYLVDKFAVTVTSFKHNLFYPIHVPAFSDTLAHLSLIMNPKTMENLPRVNTDALKTLKLRNYPTDYSWASFANGQTPGSISFAQLKRLDIYFSYYTSELSHNLQMSFPALEDLRLDNWNSDIKEISTALFPAYMPNIHVSGSTQAIKSFFCHKSSGFGNFKIVIGCCDAADMETFYEMADRFFNRLRIDGQAALDIIFDSPKLDADRMNWTNLTFLTITGDIDIETISALLPRLPSLTSLKARKLVHNEDTNNSDAFNQFTPPDLASLSTAAPLSTSSPTLVNALGF
ncbi:hypothetical protein LPJ66_006435 [Kickxella alabastrina]|uniref:Uncharacterized protein n=1 Tax=Kickxella alabastrina TaxID=61397 RepID=A0ACC1IBQ8_9FUNG|nr:hypothetical protein LPJ66_006435 [Kickxella alabastrina]